MLVYTTKVSSNKVQIHKVSKSVNSVVIYYKVVIQFGTTHIKSVEINMNFCGQFVNKLRSCRQREHTLITSCWNSIGIQVCYRFITCCRARNNVSNVPDHGDQQSWFSADQMKIWPISIGYVLFICSVIMPYYCMAFVNDINRVFETMVLADQDDRQTCFWRSKPISCRSLIGRYFVPCVVRFYVCRMLLFFLNSPNEY
jgi:hypothetical protein